MSDDIVIQLKDLASTMKRGEGRSTVYGAVSEIEYLRAWAEYEHAGYCRCAGGDKECIEQAYKVWKSMQ